MSTHAALVEALTRIKANLEQQRRFSVDTLANWKRTCTSAEGDIEELLERAAIAQAAPEQPAPWKPTEQQILEAAEKAGLWPNTVRHWMPAFDRFFDALKLPAPEQPAPVAVADAEELLPHAYLFAKVAMVMPLFQEARDALTALTETQRKLHGISPTLADRMDIAGTYSLDDWREFHAPTPGAQESAEGQR